MKKLLGWSLAWLFYYGGCVAYWILMCADNHERWVKLWFPVYNDDMTSSVKLQTWAGGHGKWWPWGEPYKVTIDGDIKDVTKFNRDRPYEPEQ